MTTQSIILQIEFLNLKWVHIAQTLAETVSEMYFNTNNIPCFGASEKGAVGKHLLQSHNKQQFLDAFKIDVFTN